MSYQSRRPVRSMVPRVPLGGFLDDLLDSMVPSLQRSTDEACRVLAERSPIIAQRQAQIDDLSNNWNPTGFYTPNQLGQAIAFTMTLTESTQSAIRSALGGAQLPQHVTLLQQATDDLSKSIGVGGFGVDPIGPYDAAVQNARATGKDAIEAQGFKRTVLSVMRATRDAFKVVLLVGCARPAFLDILVGAGRAFDALVDFLHTVVGIIGIVAGAVAKIPDALGTLFSVLKWSALAGGVYFIGVKAGAIPEKFDPLNLRK